MNQNPLMVSEIRLRIGIKSLILTVKGNNFYDIKSIQVKLSGYWETMAIVI